jgi:hypothetical protein
MEEMEQQRSLHGRQSGHGTSIGPACPFADAFGSVVALGGAIRVATGPGCPVTRITAYAIASSA